MTEAPFYANWLEADRLPDWVIRAGIRQQLRARLHEQSSGGEDVWAERKRRFVEALRGSAIAVHTAAANIQHYEVPAAFYHHVLGPHLKYSAGLWNGPETTLADAESAMLDLTIERAAIRDGQRILELGCGWGSLTLAMAARFPHSRIVAVSNSASQRASIRRAADDRGLTNISLVTADMNAFEPADAPFDRVVSVEMFEHMRNYHALLSRIAGWLAPDGRLFVHIFAHQRFAYPYEVRDATDWMAEHFFTGGTMPSVDLFDHFQEDLTVEARWVVNGSHYARTCEAWLRRMDANREAIDRILAEAYGPGHASVTRWRVRWRVFFMACAELFAYRRGEEWLVAHYRFKKRG